MKELINLRKPREKHYLNEDGTITLQLFNEDIHYLKGGVYHEIDNTLVDKGNHYKNKSNDFQTIFTKDSNDLVNIVKDNYYLKMFLKDYQSLNLEKRNNTIKYKNIQNNIDFNYEIRFNKLKESIILSCRETVPEKLSFIIDTNLSLKLTDNKTIEAYSEAELIFTIDAPYMFDAIGNANYCLEYELREESNQYQIDLVLDTEWLKDSSTIFPVTVDPTIINGHGINVFDTYISSNNPTRIYGDKKYIRIGVGDGNDIYRALIKFTLPEIGPSYNIINATAFFTAYDNNFRPLYVDERIVNVHAINKSWDEYNVNWDEYNVNWDAFANNYDTKIETFFSPNRFFPESTESQRISEVDLTNIVKKWYAGHENNGVLLKWNDESYSSDITPFICFSKCYDANNNTSNRPYMTITYTYQNGLYSQMDYNKLNFKNGSTNINNFNGNLINVFNVNKTLYGSLPLNLSVVYNSCDAVLNNVTSVARGWKFNYYETLKSVTVDGSEYLEYLDEYSGFHYFVKFLDGTYQDEEGMQLTLRLENGKYIMSDSEGNTKEFTKTNDTYYLTKINDIAGNSIHITYSNNKISKITSDANEEIVLNYTDNLITITSIYDTSKIYLSNNIITKIETKNGNTEFINNTTNLITKIIDSNSNYVTFEYYQTPHRIKKVSSYNAANTLYNSYTYTYSYNVTNIVNLDNMKTVLTFDNLGKTLSTTLYDNNLKSLKNAYGYSQTYVQDMFSNVNVNNVSSKTMPLKFTKNLLTNSSFEFNYAPNFTYSNSEIVTDYAKTGTKSLKFDSSLTLEYNILESNIYTISFDLKKTSKGTAKLYAKSNNVLTEIASRTLTHFNDAFERYNLTASFEAGVTLVLKIILESDLGYIDDIQLEYGKVANRYNIVDNCDFKNGITSWSISDDATYEVVTIENGDKAFKLCSDPEGSSAISQHFNISGKEGDVYNLSFWYKNEGVTETDYDYFGNMVNLQFFTTDEYGAGTWNAHMNYHADEWQFFSGDFVAETDYTDFNLNIITQFEANAIYVTNFMLIKDLGSVGNLYDEHGNLVSQCDMTRNETNYKYDKNNQLVASFTPKGSNFKYEYDSVVTDRVLKGISPTGISNEYVYDEYGNVIKTIINNVNKDGYIINGNKYYIRLNGTNKYLNYDYNNQNFLIKEDSCNHKYFEIVESDYYYRIKFNESYLTYYEDNILLSKSETDINLYKIMLNTNGSFSIYPKNKDDFCLTINNGQLIFQKYEENNPKQQFYFEDCNTNKMIVREAIYDDNHKNIIKEVDALGKVTLYDIDDDTRLTNSFTNPLGLTTNYTYNDRELLTKLKVGNKEKTYEYNTDNLLTKITSDNKTISFGYDSLSRPTFVKINNNTIVNKSYDSKGNLEKVDYANGYSPTFSYDKFNNIISCSKNNDTYNYLYNNLGSLTKITSNNDTYEYYYDYAERLQEYILNDIYKIRYSYDLNGNILNRTIYFEGNTYNIDYVYNGDDSIINVTSDNINMDIIYDELGRLESQNINDNISYEYSYFGNGNKTSLILKSMKINNDIYEYRYDDLYNIAKIYLNNELQYEYKYDEISELVQDIDYIHGSKNTYTYDNNGNILFKKKYSLNDQLIENHTYLYENEEWLDQVTNYDGNVITYDDMGNMKTFGNKTFNWNYGTHLSSYTDQNKTVNFKYDVNDLLQSKEINNSITNYYYEEGSLTLEKRNNHVLYYIYDSNEGLIGFKYDNVVYYYKKNSSNDILGIYDSNYNLIVNYEYDVWGNFRVLDNSGNEITDMTNIGHINPYKFRSYYYDNDLEMYWLQSRYYSPTLGRFINPDSQVCSDILGDNLYVYCGNNPVTRNDNSGNLWHIGAIAGGAFLGGIVSASVKVASNLITKKKWNEGIIGAAVSGAVAGAIVASPYKKAFSSLATALISGFTGASANEAINYTSFSKYNGSKRKKVTKKNIKESVKNIVVDTSLSTIYTPGGNLVSRAIGRGIGISVPDVGRPAEKFLTAFIGKRALKMATIDFFTTSYVETISSCLKFTVNSSQQVLKSIY